jgi:hypothetical protein
MTLLHLTALTTVRLQCQGPYEVHILITATDMAPATIEGSVQLTLQSSALTSEVPLSTHFGGALTGAVFVWGYSEAGSSVSLAFA